MTQPMSEPPMVHRMADPAVRLRVVVMIVCLVALSWVSVSMLGRDGGAFLEQELPDVAGLPILVPQIERLIPPRTGELPELSITTIPTPAPGTGTGAPSP